MKLYVGNLPANTSAKDLEDLFHQCCQVKDDAKNGCAIECKPGFASCVEVKESAAQGRYLVAKEEADSIMFYSMSLFSSSANTHIHTLQALGVKQAATQLLGDCERRR